MNDRPSLGVVIPTRDRRATLLATLAVLDRQQDLPAPLEVVVVDDGSRDGTGAALADARWERLRLRSLRQAPAGPAAARNRGIAAAEGRRVLLLGDDTPPLPGALAAHAGAPADAALLGPIDWDPASEVTPVMRFLAPAGPQFYFKGLTDGGPVPWRAVLGSNLSAPRERFAAEPFDERFTGAALEDSELAYRWSRRGWPVLFSTRARAVHRHRYDRLEPFLARQARAGRAARLALRLHPGMAPALLLHPLALAPLVVARGLLGGARRRREALWDLRCRAALLGGFLGLARGARSVRR